MKKIFAFTIAVILVLSFESISQTQNQALIFSIDVSRSMLQPPGFYQKLKDNIKNYIKNEAQVNDLVTIYSFGDDVRIISDVVNFKVTSVQDIEKLTQFIDKLSPTDNKTFLTKAIDVLASQMESLQKQYESLPIKAFLFTDGKNEPPTGVSSLNLAQILSKHKTTFQNPFTFTYIITLGTELDKELQTLVNTPNSGVSEIPGSKELTKREVKIILQSQKVRVNLSSVSEVNAKFQFLTINNIEKGTIKFEIISGDEIKLSNDVVNFDPNYVGKYFNLPLIMSSNVKSGVKNLRLRIIPVKDNFNVTPREVGVEIIIEEVSIDLIDEQINVEQTSKGGTTKVNIIGKNNSQSDVKVLPIINPSDDLFVYEGESIILPKGDFEQEIEFKVNPTSIGEYPYSLAFQPINSDVKIAKSIPIVLKITEPFNWGPILTIIIILLILGLIGGLGYLYFYLVDREFAKYTISGMSLNKEPLNEFKKFWQTKIIVGKNIFSDTIGEEIFTIKADLLTPFKKELKLEWSQVNKDRILPIDVLSYDALIPLRVQFNKKYQFEIEKKNN